MQAIVDSHGLSCSKEPSLSRSSRIKEAFPNNLNPWARSRAEGCDPSGWWNIPKEIFLFIGRQETSFLPRGSASQLAQGLDIVWLGSARRNMNQPTITRKFQSERHYQEKAIEKLPCRWTRDLKISPGLGKTCCRSWNWSDDLKQKISL